MCCEEFVYYINEYSFYNKTLRIKMHMITNIQINQQYRCICLIYKQKSQSLICFRKSSLPWKRVIIDTTVSH